jgi:hypothetical protein
LHRCRQILIAFTNFRVFPQLGDQRGDWYSVFEQANPIVTIPHLESLKRTSAVSPQLRSLHSLSISQRNALELGGEEGKT